jgi:hypothetical protein
MIAATNRERPKAQAIRHSRSKTGAVAFWKLNERKFHQDIGIKPYSGDIFPYFNTIFCPAITIFLFFSEKK